MACTTAVEQVINDHYLGQIQDLERDAPSLAQFLNTCREEEIEHMETGIAQGAAQAPLSPLLQALIRWGTSLAVKIAERV